MSVLKVLTQKVGPRQVLHVDMDLNAVPVLPDVCPCCMEPVNKGSFIAVKRKGSNDLEVPACAVCARHTVINNIYGNIAGILVLIFTVLTIAGALMYRGTHIARELSGGTEYSMVGALSALKWPFTSTIRGGITMLAGLFLAIIYACIFGGLMYPVGFFLNKRTCKWFQQAVRMSSVFGSQDCQRFTFENVLYGEHFALLNGASESDVKSPKSI